MKATLHLDEMPKNCYDCRLGITFVDRRFCTPLEMRDATHLDDRRHRDCPLEPPPKPIPVPKLQKMYDKVAAELEDIRESYIRATQERDWLIRQLVLGNLDPLRDTELEDIPHNRLEILATWRIAARKVTEP